MITMTQKKAAAAVRAGLKLAAQSPNRWNPRVFLGWLLDGGGYSGVEWTDKPPVNRYGACGCALGLGALAYANGKMTLKTINFEVLPAMEDALGRHLYAQISSISSDAMGVENMIDRVEAALVENGL